MDSKEGGTEDQLRFCRTAPAEDFKSVLVPAEQHCFADHSWR